MYFEYYEPQQQYYDPAPDYDFESTSYEPEETYDDYDEGYGDDYDQPTACDVYAYSGDGNEAEILSYVEEELAHEEFEEEENLEMDFGHGEQSDDEPRGCPPCDERYVLPHYPEYEVDDSPIHTAENVVWQPPFDLDTATEAEIDACAWRSHYARGPPPDVSPDSWYDDMEAWRVSIDASLQAEEAAVLVDDVQALETRVPEVDEPGVYEPAHVTWVADMLAHLHEAHERGELPDNEYEAKLEELQADKLEEQGLLADGWIWNEESGDYWHPERGWGADIDDDEPCSDPPPSLLGTTPDCNVPAGDVSLFTPQDDQLSHLITAISSLTLSKVAVFKPAIIIGRSKTHEITCRSDDITEVVSVLSKLRLGVVGVALFCVLIRCLVLHNKSVKSLMHAPPRRYFIPRLASALRHQLPSQQRRVSRSSSARPVTRNQHRTGRRARSCPDFKRESPPHFATPSAPPTQLKVADAVVPSSPPVPPNIPKSSTTAIPDTGPAPPTSVPESPIAVVNVERAPIPPDICHPCPTSQLAAQRRQNAMRRIFKKGRLTS
ncbi:hypothetical protein GGX14DRAFT_405964 [Mycena pura]|uniref:Uncharacterized protein n=1 Tax=Mycena pura TaxID=153505 RepID=A0AAD6UUF8_9AGAR|nr:hypothetical protein GGX14DRAFT_405964 [Mycena pura]